MQRHFVRSRVALSALLLAAFAAQGAETTWNIQIWGPKRASAAPLEWYAQEVTARTGGQMKFNFSFEKGKATDAVDLLKTGTADGAYICTQYTADKTPLVGVLDLPMFSPDRVSVLGRVELALADHPAIENELKRFNIKLLVPVPLPQYQVMGTRRIAKVDDFQGSRIRIGGEMGRVLTDYGAQISTIPATEAAAGVKDGKIDLVALPYPYAFAAYKIEDVSKYVTDKISLGAPLCYLGANHKSWEALPPAVKKVMLELRPLAVARFEQAYAAEDAGNVARFKSRGLEFVEFSAADRARLVAKAIKIWNAWIEEREKQGLPGREVFEFTQGKIREYGRK